MLKAGGKKEIVEINSKLNKNQKGKNKKTEYKHVAIANLASGLITGGACAAGIVSLPFVIPLAVTSLGAYGTIDYLLNNKKELEWERLFKNIGLQNKDEEIPQLIESVETSYGVCHSFTCPVGLSVEDFEAKLGKFKTFVNCKRIKINFKNKRMFIRVYSVELESKYEFVPCADGILPFPMGVNVEKIILEDLADAPHMFICGETGSGKSTALNVFLCNLILTKTEKEVELYLADGKGGSELWDYEYCRHTKCFAKNIEEINIMMEKVFKILEERQEILMINGCKNVGAYNKKFPNNKLSRIVVVFDEINIVRGITEERKKLGKSVLGYVTTLCEQGRSNGIHLALCTQLPYAKLIEGPITGNTPLKIGFKVEKKVHSQMIIGSDELIELKGNGHGIVKIGMDKREFQGYYIDSHKIDELLQGTYRAKGKEINNEQIKEPIKPKKPKKPNNTEKPKTENKKETKSENYKKPKLAETINHEEVIEMEEVKDQGELNDLSFLNKFK